MKRQIIALLSVVFFVELAFCQDYAGSEMCAMCHGSRYNLWAVTGHHNTLNVIDGSQAPIYPFEYISGTPNVENLPIVNGFQLGWNDISYVIGGYYWKAHFTDTDGYIITGNASDETQWNVQAQSWSGYHAGEENLPFDCGRCHSTGYDETGHQGGMEGIIGTWSEDGVGCEACHGAGSAHITYPSTTNIVMDSTSELCGGCHYRDSEHRIEASGNFVKSREQYDEMLHSPHYDELTCNTCHHYHKSTVYDQGGLRPSPSCSDCHENHVIEGKEALTCQDCHMPYSVKSAASAGENEGDVHSHQFRIWVTTFPKDSMFYSDENGTYVRTDESGQVYGSTLDFVCLRCHTGWTIDDVYEIARDIHQEGLYTEPEAESIITEEFVILQNYPNPFNHSTTIEFSVPQDNFATLSVFDNSGRLVEELYSQYTTAGIHRAEFNGTDFSSGIYLCRLTTGSHIQTKKILSIK